MKFIICIVVIVSLIAAAANDNDGDSGDLFDLIHRRTSPQELLAFLNGSGLSGSFYSFDDIKETLSHAIRTGQLESLQTLWHCVCFPRNRTHDAIRQLLIVGILNHKSDACHFLMSQVPRLENSEGVPDQIPIWLGISSGWTAQELISLVEAHPGFAACFSDTPEEMIQCNDLGVGLAMLQFNSHFASKDPDFATIESTRPSALLRSLLHNFFLRDTDMALLTKRLCESGNADVTYELVKDFERSNADHVQTLEILRGWIQEDVKVTEEESDNVK